MTDTEAPLVGDIEPLTALDRCDSCTSAAKVRVTLSTGSLQFCGHCANKNLPVIEGLGLVVALRDEREFVAAR
jgi:hypothetical protein